MSVSESEIREYLRGLEFPADRTAILENAAERGAPEPVVQSFESLSMTELFDGPNEIIKELPAEG